MVRMRYTFRLTAKYMTERHSPSGGGHGLELHVNYIYDDITLWPAVDNQREESFQITT